MAKTSNYVGVYLHNSGAKDRMNPGSSWVAQIARSNQIFKVGSFDNNNLAAAAFDLASRRTVAWALRRTRTNFTTQEEAEALIPANELKSIATAIDEIVEALRRIDPTAESRYRSRLNAEMTSDTDEDGAICALLQTINNETSGARLRVKNALRAKDERLTALQTSLDQYKVLAHERACEIDRLKGELEIATSAAGRVKFEIKPVGLPVVDTAQTATKAEPPLSEDPIDEDELGSDEDEIGSE